MKILYFAWIRERIGKPEETLNPPEDIETVSDLVDWLETRHPGYQEAFSDRSKIRVALDQDFVPFEAPLKGAGEVAFFPPVTGG